MKQATKYFTLLGIILLIIIGGFGVYSYYCRPANHQNPIPCESSEHKKSFQPIIGSNRGLCTHGVKFLPFPEDFVDEYDIGLKKWILCFENLKASDCQSCEILRLSPNSNKTDAFEPLIPNVQDYTNFSLEKSPIKTKSGKTSDLPKANFILGVSERGFLPGEKVTVRAKSHFSEKYDTISFYPRPIVLYDRNGKELAGAELESIKLTIYVVNLAFNPDNRIVQIHGQSDQENLYQSIVQNEPITMIYIPGVINKKGGVNSLELTYQNGDTYTLSLPWGEELIPYALGLK